MIAETINESFCLTNVDAKDWEDAVRIAGQLLIDNDCVTQEYVDDMIEVVHEYGPYIVIAPGIALAHARPEKGAKRIAVSFVTLKTPIYFGNEGNDPVKLVLGLAAVNNTSHLEAIRDCIKYLSDESLEVIYNCETPEELVAHIKSFG